MKSVGAALLVLTLAGCFGPYYEHTPMVGSDGTKFYLLKSAATFTDQSKIDAAMDLDKRSQKICSAGYTLVNQEIVPVNNPAGFHSGSYDVHWQIKCKNLS
jgi:hypothetical protein